VADVAHLLHELADVVIVAYGTASFLGVDLEDVIREAMLAGMSKVPNPDPNGKALKPEDFVPADERIRWLVDRVDQVGRTAARPNLTDYQGHGYWSTEGGTIT
jgi:predicted HAD superfamily Cof-like phosphohydrolase